MALSQPQALVDNKLQSSAEVLSASSWEYCPAVGKMVTVNSPAVLVSIDTTAAFSHCPAVIVNCTIYFPVFT